MNKDTFLEFFDTFANEMRTIVEAKNNDYTNNGDMFANFKAVENLGIKTEHRFLTRMMDKLMRITAAVSGTELQVEDERVRDTLMDLANYTILLAGYIHSKGTGK